MHLRKSFEVMTFPLSLTVVLCYQWVLLVVEDEVMLGRIRQLRATTGCARIEASGRPQHSWPSPRGLLWDLEWYELGTLPIGCCLAATCLAGAERE